MQTRLNTDFIWTLPQPIVVLGAALLTASAAVNEWMDAGLLLLIFFWLPIPLILIAERLLPKRQDWLLDRRDLVIDAFYVLSASFIWFPILDETYDTPISNLFESIRDSSGFPFRLEAETTLGVVLAAIVASSASELIG